MTDPIQPPPPAPCEACGHVRKLSPGPARVCQQCWVESAYLHPFSRREREAIDRKRKEAARRADADQDS